MEFRRHIWNRFTELRFVFAILFVFPALLARAQLSGDSEFAVQSWDNTDGLPNSPVTALARTSDGYMWIGTRAGLARFDGVRFVTLTTNTTPAMDNQSISCLYIDRDTVLWVGTPSGTLMRRKGDVFEPISLSDRLRRIPIAALAQETDGTLWVATRGAGLVRCRNTQYDFFGTTNGLPDNIVSQLIADRQGKLWAIAGSKLVTLEKGRWQIPVGLPPLEGELLAVTPSHDGGLWVATTFPQLLSGRGGKIFKLKDGQWHDELAPYLWAQDTVFTRLTGLLEDRDGRLWVGTPGAGLFVWHDESKWRRLATSGALAQLDCSALGSDGEDGIWVGTNLGELHQARHRPVKTFHLPALAEKNILNNVCVTRDGSTWVGTDGAGLFRLRDGEFKRYGEDEGLTSGHIGVVFEDSRTNLWVGTWDGLFRQNAGRFVAAPGPSPLRQVVLTMCEDREGALWAGTGGGVVKMSREEIKVFGKAEGVDHFYIRGITQDSQGQIWLAIMDRGLYRLKDGRFSRYGEGQWESQGLTRAIYADADGALWIATFGAGLVRLKDGQFRKWSVRDGLPSDRIVSVTEDAAGNIWCTSEDGIFGCPKARFENYERGVTPRLLIWHMSVAEGLETKKCNGAGQPVIGRSADGQLWFPNWRALAVFDPAEIPRVWSMWPVLIEEAVVDGKAQLPSSAGELVVKSTARSYEFHYTSANLRTADRVRFRYQLKGSDLNWVEADQRRAAYYSRLPAGEYEFRVMAGGPIGIWQEASQRLRLVVEPMFWERRSVQAAGILALVAAAAVTVWSVERSRTRRRLQLVEAQQAMERERRRIARDLHDDLGAGLAEVVLLGELARQENVSPGEVRAHVFDMTEKTRQLVTAMDEIVWTVNPRNDTIPNLASYVAEHARKFFSSTPIQCRLNIMSDLPSLPVPAAVRHNLFLAVKEALHNAVKHSHAREVWLRMRWANDEFTLEVQDDGRGFDPQKAAQEGDGLENMEHRLQAVGGRTTILSQPDGGTTIRFNLSVPRNGNTAT